MSASADIEAVARSPIAWGIAAILGVFAAVYLVRQAAQGVASVGESAANAVNNVNAGTPYAGAGVVGTLGNATNALSGGVLEQIGNTIGGWLADVTTSSNPPQNSAQTLNSSGSAWSGSVQTQSATPYSVGPNASYADAVNSSPPDPSYTVNPLSGAASAGMVTD